MVDVVHIPVEGPVKVVKLEESGDSTLLRGMQDLVGGLIERIPLHHNCNLWFNEEAGIQLPRPQINEVATGIGIILSLRPVLMHDGAIWGPAFVAGRRGGEITDVNPDIMPQLIVMAASRWEGESD